MTSIVSESKQIVIYTKLLLYSIYEAKHNDVYRKSNKTAVKFDKSDVIAASPSYI